MPEAVNGVLGSHSSTNQDQTKTPIGERWWNANLQEAKWTEECPEFLLGEGSKNIGILSSRDEDHRLLSWEESKALVETNHIHHFGRLPTELRRYLKYIFQLKQHYGSVLSFVQHQRLHWEEAVPSAEPPFTNPADFKVLYNDWPYAIDPDITHLVVWTKFILVDDATTGQLTREWHDMIDRYVVQTFCVQGGLSRDRVIWFKNWKSLKSVHALEHFHVMVYKASSAFLQQITDNDRPVSETFADN